MVCSQNAGGISSNELSFQMLLLTRFFDVLKYLLKNSTSYNLNCAVPSVTSSSVNCGLEYVNKKTKNVFVENLSL